VASRAGFAPALEGPPQTALYGVPPDKSDRLLGRSVGQGSAGWLVALSVPDSEPARTCVLWPGPRREGRPACGSLDGAGGLESVGPLPA